MRLLSLILVLVALLALAPESRAQTSDLPAIVAEHAAQIAKPSRQTIGPVIEAIAATGPQGAALLRAWVTGNWRSPRRALRW